MKEKRRTKDGNGKPMEKASLWNGNDNEYKENRKYTTHHTTPSIGIKEKIEKKELKTKEIQLHSS